MSIMNTSHTPTPWTNDEHSAYVWNKEGNVCVCGDPTADSIVGYTEAGRSTEGLHAAVANARHIVHSVNSHDDLLAALTALVKAYEDVQNGKRNSLTEQHAEYQQAIAAIKKAQP